MIDTKMLHPQTRADGAITVFALPRLILWSGSTRLSASLRSSAWSWEWASSGVRPK